MVAAPAKALGYWLKPPRFDYARADDPEAAIELLAEHGEDARILAGGQSLIAVLNMRLAQPKLLIDISRSSVLGIATVEKNFLAIGAAATQSSIEARPRLAREVPLLAQALPHISHFQIRNRGTVCGSLAHADPSAELPLVLLALEGHVVLASSARQRRLAASDFFTGMLTTARAPDELLAAAHYPLAEPGAGHAFAEFSLRHGDYAVCAVAVVARRSGLRIAVGGVADRPSARNFPPLDGSALDDALNEFAWSLDARDDPMVSAVARRALVRSLGRRAVQQAQHNARTA